MSQFLLECYLQKANQYEALKVFEEHSENLEMGKILILSIDKDDDDKELCVC